MEAEKLKSIKCSIGKHIIQDIYIYKGLHKFNLNVDDAEMNQLHVGSLLFDRLKSEDKEQLEVSEP